jgi:polysaccharide biosynthesis transport protein
MESGSQALLPAVDANVPARALPGLALPGTEGPSIRDYLAVLRRRKTLLLAVTLGALLLSLLVAMLLPSVYESTATILIEQQEIPEDLIRSTVTGYADQRVQVISQRVMTTANLTEIIKKFNLYAKERDSEPLEVIVQNMRDDDIKMELVNADVMDPRNGQPNRATIAFTVSYRSKSADLAQRVANELVSLYLSENIKSRTQSAAEASNFLTREAQHLRDVIVDSETRLAVFKEKHFDRLPDLLQVNTQILDRTEQEVGDINRQIQSLDDRRIMLRAQVSQVKPSGALISETGERILGSSDRLKVLQSEYIAAAGRYQPDHPDVLRLKREIDALREVASGGHVSGNGEVGLQITRLRADLAAARKRYSSSHPDVRKLQRELQNLEAAGRQASVARIKTSGGYSTTDNPAYVEVRAQLDAVEADIRAARERKVEMQLKVEELEQRLMQSPQVEREYRELMRDYESAQAKYQEITHKQMEAKLAENLETARKGERLTLIDPPLLPEKPSSPNRPLIAILGSVLSLAAGFGSTFLAESLDSRVHSSRDIARLLGVMPLSAIPYIETEQDHRRERDRLRIYITALLALLLALALAVHNFIIPLDVLWFRAARRLFGI